MASDGDRVMITPTLDRSDYRDLRIYAAGQESSVARVLRALIQRVVTEEDLADAIARDLALGAGKPGAGRVEHEERSRRNDPSKVSPVPGGASGDVVESPDGHAFSRRSAARPPTGSARFDAEPVILADMMVQQTVTFPVEVHDRILERAKELQIPLSAVVRQATALGLDEVWQAEPPPSVSFVVDGVNIANPPRSVGKPAQRTWLALAQAGRPMTSEDLAVELNRHRGNVDRALRELRAAGYVERHAPGLHIATQPDQQHQEAPLAS